MSIDLSLDRLSQLLQHIQPYTRPTIHVAGTNGKGSVTAMLSSILRSSQPPLSVGRFNSPHLVTVRDCIVINEEMVSDKRYSEARQLVEEADLEHGTKLTHFEILTATALLVFELEKVDIVVAEVGLGGRLDATNTIPDEAICVSALTSVGLDHQKFLGDTPIAIAREKAGIARRGKPFVLGKQEYAEAKDVVKEVVQNVGGDLVEAVQVLERDWDLDFDGERARYIHLSSDNFVQPLSQPVSLSMHCFSKPLRSLLPLYGHHQLDNLAITSTIVSTLLTHPSCRHLNLKDRITETSVDRGIREVRWPGRLAFHRFRIGQRSMIALVDGAHNSASASTLSDYIKHLLSLLDPKASRVALTYILGLSHSPPKTALQTLSPLFPPRILDSSSVTSVSVRVAAMEFSPPEGMPWVKAVRPNEILDVVQALVPEVEVLRSDSPRLEDALTWASGFQDNTESLVVVAGSLYLVADFYRFLRAQEGVQH